MYKINNNEILLIKKINIDSYSEYISIYELDSQ